MTNMQKTIKRLMAKHVTDLSAGIFVGLLVSVIIVPSVVNADMNTAPLTVASG